MLALDSEALSKKSKAYYSGLNSQNRISFFERGAGVHFTISK